MKTKSVLVVLLLMVSILSAPPNSLTQTTQPKSVAIRCGKLLDVKTGDYVSNAVILIEGGRIKEVGATVKIPPETQVVDLSNAAVLPGLIDSHTHLLQNYDGELGNDDNNMILTVTQLGTTKRALLGAAMGREDLEAGITTVRDLGNSGINGDVALRDAINQGWVIGPRMIVSTRALSAAGGQFGRVSAETQKIIEQEYAVIGNVEEARRAVQQALYDGADCIKVIVDTYPRIVTLESMKAIVEEAHRVGKKVAAHAVTDMAVRIAAEAGVDSVEHGYGASDEAFKLMAEKKVFLVPTDGTLDDYLAIFGARAISPEAMKQRREQMEIGIKQLHDRVARAIKAGVRIAAGSDMYYRMPGKTRGQASLTMLHAYSESGMSNLEIIRAATLNAAELLGWQTRIGAIEAGKFADLIATEGDPLKDIRALDNVKFVMKGGAVIKNDLGKK